MSTYDRVAGSADHPPHGARLGFGRRSGPSALGRFSAAGLAAIAVAGLGAGGVLHALGSPSARNGVWVAATVAVMASELWPTLRALARRSLSVDIIALVAMGAAVALGEYLPGVLVAVMMAGGRALEQWASRRAARDLSLLVDRAPRTANIIRDDRIARVDVDTVRPGDTVLVRTGEVVAVDGVLDDDAGVFDESALSGEPLPVVRIAGQELRSGIANAGEPVRMTARRQASESTYAGIVELVTQAQSRRAPFQRLADRYAAWFLPLTFVTAGLAWAASGNVIRGLAVLVVATPCPLILAAPVALVSGVSRIARSGVILKGADVIERLASARTVMIDKTGTLTHGAPEVTRVIALPGHDSDDVLAAAASLDQMSVHPAAHAIVRFAQSRRLELATPRYTHEEPGRGIRGRLGRRAIVVGQPEWVETAGVPDAVPAADAAVKPAPGTARVVVGIDGRPACVIVLSDRVRDDARALVGRFRGSGIGEVWLVTGDQAETAGAVGGSAGVDRVLADRSPDEKLTAVRDAQAAGRGPVMMVGDGINDAPALAAADVGIALGASGATVASQTADAVVMIDRIEPVADAVDISRRAMRIARQSVLAGMTMSLAAMAAAAVGLIPPTGGAILQEGIDLAVIANALRALRPAP